MLSIKSGNVGSGKTLSTIKIICNRLLSGEKIVSNINFNYEKFKDDNKDAREIGEYFHVDDITVEYLLLHAYKYHDLKSSVENQTLLIIDESRVYFDARTWNTDKTRADWREFFEQHRKLKFNVILICQDYTDLDPKVYGKAEYIEYHRKINNAAGFGFILNILHIQLFYCVIKFNSPAQRVHTKEYFLYKKKFGSYYRTDQLLNGLDEKFKAVIEKYEESLKASEVTELEVC